MISSGSHFHRSKAENHRWWEWDGESKSPALTSLPDVPNLICQAVRIPGKPKLIRHMANYRCGIREGNLYDR